MGLSRIDFLLNGRLYCIGQLYCIRVSRKGLSRIDLLLIGQLYCIRVPARGSRIDFLLKDKYHEISHRGLTRKDFLPKKQ